MRALGLMSGTSLDGVDAAIIETDGRVVLDAGPALTIPYSAEDRAILQAAAIDAVAAGARGAEPQSFGDAAGVVERNHVAAIETLLAEPGAGVVQLIGFHGQTVLHRPELGLTIQLGDGDALAQAVGIDVVWDLRRADMRAGGQGAPIMPVYHRALVGRTELPRPLAVLNLGGVANLTWIGGDGELIAFDTGPGNGLLDQLVASAGLGRYDEGGVLAATGRVDNDVLARALAHPYFMLPPPKSIDRYDFTLELVGGLSVADAAATLTAFSAAAVAIAADRLPAPPRRWLACGGGRHNATLIRELRARLTAPVDDGDVLGWRGDAIEAEGMALLAVRSVMGLPLTYPGTTGADRPTTGGRTARAAPGAPRGEGWSARR